MYTHNFGATRRDKFLFGQSVQNTKSLLFCEICSPLLSSSSVGFFSHLVKIIASATMLQIVFLDIDIKQWAARIVAKNALSSHFY